VKVNRLQLAVLVFFGLAWSSLLAILALDPAVYAQALHLAPGSGAAPELAFLAALTVFLAVVGAGVVKRWRWTFWLLAAAFVIGGALRIPASLLQLAGRLPSSGPPWYEGFQAVVGAIQLAIGLVMLGGYRSGGVWATPSRRR